MSDPIESTPMDDNCIASISKERQEAKGLSRNPYADFDPIMERVVATIAAVRAPDEQVIISADILTHIIALVRSDERNKASKHYIPWDTDKADVETATD